VSELHRQSTHKKHRVLGMGVYWELPTNQYHQQIVNSTYNLQWRLHGLTVQF
jgi:hypothetical protein